MQKGRNILINTLLLTGASMFMRAAAVSFQVYLAGTIGAAGIGLFGLVTSVQILAMTVAVSGVRFATTRLVSEEIGRGYGGNAPRLMRRAFLHALFFGTLAGMVLFFGAQWIGSVWIGDRRTIFSLRILAVGMPFLACSAAMSGYFVAVSRVVKAAGVSVLEHVLRIAMVVVLLTWIAPTGMEWATALIVIGGVAAEIVSCLILFALYRRDKRQLPQEKGDSKHLTRRLLSISMPLAASSYARSGLNTLQHMLVPRGLKRAGATGDDALASYGLVHGMALPIVLFPSAVFYAVAELTIPELTAAQVTGDTARIRYLVSKLLRIALYLSIGLAGMFLVLGNTLGQVVYSGTHGVGPYIRILALLMPVMFLDAMTDGMLKGLGQQVYSMGVNIADSLISVVLVWILLPIFGVWGFLFMVYFTEVFNFAFSIRRVMQITRIDLTISDVVLPVVAVVAATQGVVVFLRLFAMPLTATVISVALHFLLAGAVYLGLLMLVGCITKNDLRWARRLVAG